MDYQQIKLFFSFNGVTRVIIIERKWNVPHKHTYMGINLYLFDYLWLSVICLFLNCVYFNISLIAGKCIPRKWWFNEEFLMAANWSMTTWWMSWWTRGVDWSGHNTYGEITEREHISNATASNSFVFSPSVRVSMKFFDSNFPFDSFLASNSSYCLTAAICSILFCHLLIPTETKQNLLWKRHFKQRSVEWSTV